MKEWNNVLIVIPSLNPSIKLIDYINSLNSAGFLQILIVDDGSEPTCKPIFDTFSQNSACTIMNHAINLGKGRAIKNSINYFLNIPADKRPLGIITVDSDGQHTVNDVIAIAKTMVNNPDYLILGCRNFSSNASADVPWKSLLGNRITSIIFRLLFSKTIHDTQTGLRGIPEILMPYIISLSGERFEYETNMLIHAVKNNISITEIPIKTVYINNNEETHFHPIKDSFRIISLMLTTFFKYLLTSLLSFTIDILLFQLFILLFINTTDSIRIICSTILARTGSSLFNFFINKIFVFEQKNQETRIYIIRYYCLCIIQMLISAGAVSILYKIFPISESIIKILVDTILFFFSFQIQQFWVFKNNN